MKKRILALALSLCLCLTLSFSSASPVRADDGVCFIALNDALLELSSQAYVQRSTVYVPYTVFENYRIYHSYYASGSTASLYTSGKQIYFELTSGNTYDGDGTYYSTSAFLRGSTVFVSVAFVCSQFGLSWSYIQGVGNGDIVRITDGGAVLSDSQFLSAASSLMAARYAAWTGATPSGGAGNNPGGSGGDTGDGCDVYLSFVGLPSAALLDALRARKAPACFFLTAQEVRDDPDTVRRIAGEGHALGVLCSADPEAEYAETEDLLFETAQVETLLVASAGADFDAAVRAAAKQQGLVFWSYDIDGIQGGEGVASASLITAYLGFRRDRADVRLQCCAATDGSIASLLSFLGAGGYQIRPLREVDNLP